MNQSNQNFTLQDLLKLGNEVSAWYNVGTILPTPRETELMREIIAKHSKRKLPNFKVRKLHEEDPETTYSSDVFFQVLVGEVAADSKLDILLRHYHQPPQPESGSPSDICSIMFSSNGNPDRIVFNERSAGQIFNLYNLAYGNWKDNGNKSLFDYELAREARLKEEMRVALPEFVKKHLVIFGNPQSYKA